MNDHNAYHKLVKMPTLLICTQCTASCANNKLELCKGSHMQVGTHKKFPLMLKRDTKYMHQSKFLM
jgi:hypothetical protein